MTSLTTQERARFDQEGFLVLRQRFDAAEVGAILAGADRVEAEASRLTSAVSLPVGRSGHVHGGAHFVFQKPSELAPAQTVLVGWACGFDQTLSRFGMDARLTGLARELLGTDGLEQLICQLHFKRPGSQVSFPWHQDAVHRRMHEGLFTDVLGNGSFLQTILALDPTPADAGPLNLVVGSHRLGLLPVDRPGPDGGLDPSLWSGLSVVAPELMPGDLLVMGPYLVHGSAANRSASPRRVFINGFAAAGANKRVYAAAGLGRRV